MNSERIFIIGFMGSDRRGVAEKLASEKGLELIDLDAEIEKKEKLTIRRLCMMMGEHAYRNSEYEMLLELTAAGESAEAVNQTAADEAFEAANHDAAGEAFEAANHDAAGEAFEAANHDAAGESDRAGSCRKGVVVICGDGIVFDDMCVDLLRKGTVVVADADKSVDELWANAKSDESIPYAFMLSSDENEKYEKFCRMHEARMSLYQQFIE